MCLLFLLVSPTYFSTLPDRAGGTKKREINTKVRGKGKHPFQYFYWFELTQYIYIFFNQSPDKTHLKLFHFLKLFLIWSSLPIFTALAQTIDCPGKSFDGLWILSWGQQHWGRQTALCSTPSPDVAMLSRAFSAPKSHVRGWSLSAMSSHSWKFSAWPISSWSIH